MAGHGGCEMFNLNFIKKIFKKNQKEEDLKPKEEVVIPPGFKVRECYFCEQDILPGERWTKKVGYYLHKVCWMKGKKLADM